jgi:nitrate reductase NapAB chaperone NapD
METKRNDFLKTIVNWGLVLRTDLDTIAATKGFLTKLPNLEIVYQIVDGGRLWVVRENERRRLDR